MSEESPENYNNGDIVWAKLGSAWWPGEVKDIDELPNEILDFKKPPLVIVKFFDEDSYEYIKSWANIYPYNCEKKNEFIKKGMAAFRAKVPHMDKFPKDVLTAEVKIGGNPNILSEPMFLPEKKRNYAAEVFGTPSPKAKGGKDKKSRPNSNKSSSQDTAHITHRRFLGVDDYRAYICIQYPGKDRVPGDREDEEVLRINREPEQEFNCHSCSFTTKRLEVMILHTKSHIQGVYVSSPRRNKHPAARKKKEKSKKSRSSDDVMDSHSSSSDSEPIQEKKRKPKSQTARKSKVKKDEKEKKEPKPVIDIRSELLAVWEDSDEDEDLDFSFSKTAESSQSLSQSITDIILGDTTGEISKEPSNETIVNEENESTGEKLNQFADDTLNELETPSQTDKVQDESNIVKESAEKITDQVTDELLDQPAQEALNQTNKEILSQPQVEVNQLLEVVTQLEITNESSDKVPDQSETESRSCDDQTEKQTAQLKPFNQLGTLNQLNDGGNDPKQLVDTLADTIQEKFNQASKLEETFSEDTEDKEIEKSKQKMDKDIQEAIKSCFDFDEDEEEDSAIVSKAAAGRKIPRVIPITERRKSHEIIEDDLNRDQILKESESFNKNTHSEDVDAAFKELMEMTTVPELPDVQNTLKCEQNFHNIKTIKFPDKLDSIGSPPRVQKAEKKEPSEIATKLTNPKKRFVKSFEDFELMQNEIRRKEEKIDVVKNEKSEAKVESVETNVEILMHNLFSNKSESVEYPVEEKLSDPSIELAVLKSNIMSRIIEEADINEESKNKIMFKMKEPKKFTVDESNTRASFSSSNEDPKIEKMGTNMSHRTPRSKILELYRNDTNKLKAEEEQKHKAEEEQKAEKADVQQLEQPTADTSLNIEEISENRLRRALTRKETVPPKKSKWSRRGSHPKKDKSLFLLEDLKMAESPFTALESDTKTEGFMNVDTYIPSENSCALSTVPSNSGNSPLGGFKPVTSEYTSALEEYKPAVTTENASSLEKFKLAVVSKKTDPLEEFKPAIASENTCPLEEIKPVVTSEYTNKLDAEAVEEKMEDEEIDKVLPTEENVEVQKDSGINAASEVEETPALSLNAETSMSSKDETEALLSIEEEIDVMNLEEEKIKVMPQQPSINEEFAKAPSSQPEHIDNTSSNVEVSDLPLENKENYILPSADENEETTRLLTQETESMKQTSDQLSLKSDLEEELPKESAVSPENNTNVNYEPFVETSQALPLDVLSPTDESVPAEVAPVNSSPSNSEAVVEEEQTQVPILKSPSPLPSSNSFTPVDNINVLSSKDPICSPKKSKKRKISESYSLPFDEINTSKDKFSTEPFSPVEKKKKEAQPREDELIEAELTEVKPGEADLKDEKNKEILSILESKVALNDIEADEKSSQESENECKSKLPHTEVSNTELEQDTPIEKPDSVMPDVVEEPTKITEHKNEVEILCASSSPDSFKFSIQTNLSNLTSREEISALALATLSEIKADLESGDSIMSEEKLEQPEKTVPSVHSESELVPIEGNLTVVSEKDLADGQVEITSQQVISPKKPVTLSNFSMDFSDSASDSNSNSTSDTLSDFVKCTDFNAGGTEFTSKAITKQVKKVDHKKEIAYERLELLNILEGNSDSEKKPKEYSQPSKNIMDDICDFEEHIPSQIVCAKTLKREAGIALMEKEKIEKSPEKSMASKLLERLSDTKDKPNIIKTKNQTDTKPPETGSKSSVKNQTVTPPTTRSTRYLGKSKPAPTTNKPIILSEQIVKSAAETAKSKPKKMLNDIEDVEAFIIHKDPKKIQLEKESLDSAQTTSAAVKSAGKAKILQQTIITPAGQVIQPTVSQAQADDNIFDINSMPIVLSDEILTPESIENMPIMIGSETKSADQEKIVKRSSQSRIITKATVTISQPIVNKTTTVPKQSRQPRILQTVGSKTIKNSPLLPSTAKPGKYIIVPQSGIQTAKYITKKAPIIKRSPTAAGIIPKVSGIAPETSGNKIMIVTNQQGQQQRLLLTPAQQKILGYQNQKAAKAIVKGNVVQKSVLATKTVPLVEAGTSGIVSKSPSLIGQKVVVGTSSNTSIITTSPQIISNQGKNIKGLPKKLQSVSQKAFPNKTQKTILIKNQHGQTVKKIQGTDDELLDKQVAEQLEAIKASAGIKFSSQPKQTEPYKATPKATIRRSYSKKSEAKLKVGPPPLSSIQLSPKPETVAKAASFSAAKKDSTESKTTPVLATEEIKPQHDRPLNQLVIQDAVGNQTTITEGQILALPSETVDGQPQSYMLVTLDESGNLTPLNSEALMSLDPNLGLGGDLSNMVLQIDQGAFAERPQTISVKANVGNETAKLVEVETPPSVSVPEPSITTEIAETVVDPKVIPTTETTQTVVPSTNGDPGQQLIVTGDPIATQKFLESLTEGTTDLANILANAEGNSILIQADGQQILINTNSDNQMLLSVNSDNVNVSESTEGCGNPIFATQPSKNQDILAAALADTDVFQQEQHTAQGKITSQLSPNNALYPMNVGNVLETSLTLSSPIMTPLEVPSTNSKKIPDDETDILTQVPKNVDLPITITDPNISQTVANQQVASLIANELQTNLELALPISETTISSVSSEMNSPSYVYSLPTLDESVDINQKPFNSSMPLLNEDIDESTDKTKPDSELKTSIEETKQDDSRSTKSQEVINSGGSFLEEEEGRYTLGGEMCSSLSEPPPEMFDLPEVNTNLEKRDANIPSSLQSTPDVSDNASKDDDLSTQAETSSEGSCEIPLQPPIVTKSLDLSQNLDSLKRGLEESEEEKSKKCKFD